MRCSFKGTLPLQIWHDSAAALASLTQKWDGEDGSIAVYTLQHARLSQTFSRSKQQTQQEHPPLVLYKFGTIALTQLRSAHNASTTHGMQLDPCACLIRLQ